MSECSTLFSLLPPLPTPEETACWDKISVGLGLPEMLLMENAAREALCVLEEEVGSLRGKRILLYMGAGRNGGDAVCLARRLVDAGAAPLVLHTRPLGSYKGVTARHIRPARACGVPFLSAFAPEIRRPVKWRQADIIVDGLLGTGFAGELREGMATLIEEINVHSGRAFVLALDVPSGLDALYGLPRPAAVRARATVCFEAAKPGLVLPEAAPFTGRVHVRSIGIPLAAQRAAPPSFRLLDASCVCCLPVAAPGSHKGTFGHVFVVGGSEGLTGAAHLAALGALRAGCGLASVAAPGGLCAEIKAAVPDILTLPLGRGRTWEEVENLRDFSAVCAAKADALVVGPGMGRSPGAGEKLTMLLRMPDRPPLVLDADALALLAAGAAPLAEVRESDILTPHPGEAGMFLGMSARQVQERRFAALRALCALHPGIWTLKGAGTLLGQRGQPSIITPHHAPCLSVGGSGDVLAGCIGSLLAQGCAPLPAAALGVLLHASAGEVLEESFPERGNSAREIADALPRARSRLRGQNALSPDFVPEAGAGESR